MLERTPPKEKRYLPLSIAAHIGDIIPLTDGTQAEIVGKWDDMVMGRRKGELHLIPLKGIVLEA